MQKFYTAIFFEKQFVLKAFLYIVNFTEQKSSYCINFYSAKTFHIANILLYKKLFILHKFYSAKKLSTAVDSRYKTPLGAGQSVSYIEGI
jgi:hypothetical protein